MGKVAIRRWFEQGYPALFSLFATGSFWVLGLHFDGSKLSNQLSAAINISAILMGFTGTANAMLLSFTSRRFQAIRANSNYWGLLLSYFRGALWSSLVLCFYSLLLFSLDITGWVADSKIQIFIWDALMPLWIGMLTLALLTFFRVLRAVFGLLHTS